MAMWFGFDPFAANANPYTAHAGHENTNLAWLAKLQPTARFVAYWLDNSV